ncbi:MAG: hypothetical protein ICV86_19925 [Microcoleus sp. T3-bin5]|nr:hypothetical protein [Microcoleus sp. T3-bin5]
MTDFGGERINASPRSKYYIELRRPKRNFMTMNRTITTINNRPRPGVAAAGGWQTRVAAGTGLFICLSSLSLYPHRIEGPTMKDRRRLKI